MEKAISVLLAPRLRIARMVLLRAAGTLMNRPEGSVRLSDDSILGGGCHQSLRHIGLTRACTCSLVRLAIGGDGKEAFGIVLDPIGEDLLGTVGFSDSH